MCVIKEKQEQTCIIIDILDDTRCTCVSNSTIRKITFYTSLTCLLFIARSISVLSRALPRLSNRYIYIYIRLSCCCCCVSFIQRLRGHSLGIYLFIFKKTSILDHYLCICMQLVNYCDHLYFTCMFNGILYTVLDWGKDA